MLRPSVRPGRGGKEVRECRGGWDPIQAQRKTWGKAVDVVRQDRTGSEFRKYPALAKIFKASNMAELMDQCGSHGQEMMVKMEKSMAGQQRAMEKLEKEKAAGGDVL